MCDLQVTGQTGLSNCAEPFENNKNYQKAIRFASPELQNELQGYIEAIKDRNEIDSKNRIYSDALEKLGYSTTEQSFREAANLFQAIPGWKDADDKHEEALKKAETARRKALYDEAVALAQEGDSKSISDAINMLSSISDSKLAEKKVEELTSLLKSAKEKEAAAEEKRLRLEGLKLQYDEENKENLSIINGRGSIFYNHRVAKDHLTQETEAKSGGGLRIWGIIQTSLGVLLLFLESPGIEIINLLFGIAALGIGLALLSAKMKKISELKKEIADYEKKIAILNSIPTLDEYVKAHKE